MKLTGKRLGYLINFNVPLIKDGINDSIYAGELLSETSCICALVAVLFMTLNYNNFYVQHSPVMYVAPLQRSPSDKILISPHRGYIMQ